MSNQLEPMVDCAPELDALDRVGAELMETMFFTEAVATPCSHAWLESAVGALVRFEGTHRGEVHLAVSPDAAQFIAGGFLGLDSLELSGEQLHHVILELANIYCGSAMSHLWPESRLALDAPELLDPRHGLETGWHRCFELPEGMLAITLRLQNDGLSAVPEGSAV